MKKNSHSDGARPRPQHGVAGIRSGAASRRACVLAYVFKLNGFKTGREELQGTDEAMKAVRIEGF